MNFNATLIGQTITFIVFVWFCMKFVWPPIMNALQERKKKIADGLAAAERGLHEKPLAAERQRCSAIGHGGNTECGAGREADQRWPLGPRRRDGTQAGRAARGRWRGLHQYRPAERYLQQG